MIDEPLYEGKGIKIDYLPGSPQDHAVWFIESPDEINYIIQRGILEDLARTPGIDCERPSLECQQTIENKLQWSHESLLFSLQVEGVPLRDLCFAIGRAYAEEERRFRKFAEENDLCTSSD